MTSVFAFVSRFSFARNMVEKVLYFLKTDSFETPWTVAHQASQEMYIYMYWKGKWQPLPALLPGKSHGQRTLLGYSLWDLKRVRHDLVIKQ